MQLEHTINLFKRLRVKLYHFEILSKITPKYHNNVVETTYLSHTLHLIDCHLDIVQKYIFWINLVHFHTEMEICFPYGLQVANVKRVVFTRPPFLILVQLGFRSRLVQQRNAIMACNEQASIRSMGSISMHDHDVDIELLGSNDIVVVIASTSYCCPSKNTALVSFFLFF